MKKRLLLITAVSIAILFVFGIGITIGRLTERNRFIKGMKKEINTIVFNGEIFMKESED